MTSKLSFYFLSLTLLSASMAYAQIPMLTNAPELGIMCVIADMLTKGYLGAGFASLGIVIVSLAALMGRVTWGSAAVVVGGIAIIFGAGQIAMALGAGGAC